MPVFSVWQEAAAQKKGRASAALLTFIDFKA